MACNTKENFDCEQKNITNVHSKIWRGAISESNAFFVYSIFTGKGEEEVEEGDGKEGRAALMTDSKQTGDSTADNEKKTAVNV